MRLVGLLVVEVDAAVVFGKIARNQPGQRRLLPVVL